MRRGKLLCTSRRIAATSRLREPCSKRGLNWRPRRGGRRETPLAYAVTCEHEAVVRLLVSHGANIHASDDDGESILDKASPKIKAVLLESNL
ncbi:unnamed protein product [Heterosigma akashiwo]